MPNTNTTTRPATPADLVVGNVVYKGNGSTEWVIVGVGGRAENEWKVLPGELPDTVSLCRRGSKSRRDGNAAYHYTKLRVRV